MKILQVIDNGYAAGGAEKCVMLLKDYLIQRGHEVLVLSSDHGREFMQSDHFSDVEFPDIYNINRSSLLGKFFKHLWYPKSYSVLLTVIKKFNPDIIHFHTLGQSTPSVLFATRKTPSVHTVHSATVYTSRILEWAYPQIPSEEGTATSAYYTLPGKIHATYNRYLQRPLYVWGFRKSINFLIAPSKYMAKVLESERFGVPIKQIYNGIKLPEQTRLQNQNHILFVGRLDYVKGVHVLINAMGIILEQLPNVHLNIVGDGPMISQLNRLTNKNCIKENVTFHGWLEGNNLTKMYKMSTVVVVPSIWPDNLPTVCIEALASGRPVVGSDVGGIPEIINSTKLGRVIPPNDPLSLAKAILSVLKDKGLGDYPRECARSAKRFQVDEYIEDHEKLYKEITK